MKNSADRRVGGPVTRKINTIQVRFGINGQEVERDVIGVVQDGSGEIIFVGRQRQIGMILENVCGYCPEGMVSDETCKVKGVNDLVRTRCKPTREVAGGERQCDLVKMSRRRRR